MSVLGSWALLNITTGIYGSLHSQEDKKAFWQMNAGWNIINIAIAGFGYYAKPELYDFQSAIHQQSSIQQLLALNIGLDIAYMLGGLYLKEKSNTTSQTQLLGFGNSLIVQGAFLLLFDCALYTTHHQHGKQLESIIKYIYPLSSGIGCSIPFRKLYYSFTYFLSLSISKFCSFLKIFNCLFSISKFIIGCCHIMIGNSIIRISSHNFRECINCLR